MSVAEYKAKFDEQSLLTKWSQVDLRTRFYDGLSDSIKDTLAITDRPIETLTELFESAQIVDTRMCQRAAEKKGQTFHQQGKSQDPSGVVPMDLDATRQGQGKQCGQNQQSSGSGKNRASWMKQMAGKCFGCGSTDHTKKNGGHDRDVMTMRLGPSFFFSFHLLSPSHPTTILWTPSLRSLCLADCALPPLSIDMPYPHRYCTTYACISTH